MSAGLPLHAAHAAAGARFEPGEGGEVAAAYGDPEAEYRAVRTAAGLLDRTDLGVVEVTGRDRATFLHALVSNDVRSLAPGRGTEAALLDPHGKVQVLLTVWVLDDRLLLVTPPGLAGRTLEMLDHYLFSEKVELHEATGQGVLLQLAGPGAPPLVQGLTGVLPDDAPWSHLAAALDGVPLRLARGGGETGEPEVWLAAAAGEGARLWAALLAAGARPVGREALEVLRIEAGRPRFGPDVDPTVLLPEIPMERLVSHTKGCYPGQEVVVRVRDRGHVNRHLRTLLLDGEAVPEAGAPVVAGQTEVGRVTSAAWSWGLKRPVALGFVRRQHAEPGTALAVRVGPGLAGARVSARPPAG